MASLAFMSNVAGAVLVTNMNANSKTIESGKVVSLFEYLLLLGETNSLYFTLEYSGVTKASVISAIATDATDMRQVTLPALLKKLNSELPAFSATQSSQFSNVIHLIAKDLNQENRNPLQQLITVRYSGSLSGYSVLDNRGIIHRNGIGLLQEIGKQTPSVVLATGGAAGEERIQDTITTVSVDAKNEALRDVLTGAIPRQGYNHILWSATLRRLNDQLVAEIRFFGPRRK
jgi:hypothetical protein